MADYFTKDQMLKVFDAWNVNEKLPRKGLAVIVCFPGQHGYQKITVAPMKSTYGKTLYQSQFLKS